MSADFLASVARAHAVTSVIAWVLAILTPQERAAEAAIVLATVYFILTVPWYLLAIRRENQRRQLAGLGFDA